MTRPAAMQAVLFDFDGTLIDSEPMWWEHEKDILTRHGIAKPTSWYYGHKGQPAPVTALEISELLAGVMSPDEVLEELESRICERYAAGEFPWLPGARELLIAVHGRGIRCVVVTASAKRIMQTVAASLPQVEFIVDGSDVTRSKPDPECYLQAMDRLGLTADEVLIIEDSLPGTTAATASGAPVLAVPTTPDVGPAPRRLLRPEGLEGLSVDDLEEIFRSLT